jgi:hypothetical protein
VACNGVAGSGVVSRWPGVSASLGLRGLLELADILGCYVGHDFLLRGELGWAYRAGSLAHCTAVAGGTGTKGCP